MRFDAAQPSGRALETLRPAPGSRAAGAALQRARKRREALGAYGVPSLVSPLVAACYVGQGLLQLGAALSTARVLSPQALAVIGAADLNLPRLVSSFCASREHE